MFSFPLQGFRRDRASSSTSWGKPARCRRGVQSKPRRSPRGKPNGRGVRSGTELVFSAASDILWAHFWCEDSRSSVHHICLHADIMDLLCCWAQCAGIGNKTSSNKIWKDLISKIGIIRFSWAPKDTQLYKWTVFWILTRIRLFSVFVVTVWCCTLCLQACSAGSSRELYSPHQKQHQISCVQLHPVRLTSHHLTQGCCANAVAARASDWSACSYFHNYQLLFFLFVMFNHVA